MRLRSSALNRAASSTVSAEETGVPSFGNPFCSFVELCRFSSTSLLICMVMMPSCSYLGYNTIATPQSLYKTENMPRKYSRSFWLPVDNMSPLTVLTLPYCVLVRPSAKTILLPCVSAAVRGHIKPHLSVAHARITQMMPNLWCRLIGDVQCRYHAAAVRRRSAAGSWSHINQASGVGV
jgi:hypothetical protein